jgi:alpha-L-fucosidase 2
MDNQIARDLFRNYLEASRILKKDENFASKVKVALGKLPPHQIGKFGQLQEWLYDFKEVQVGHRHISHLYASYPDDDITLRNTPELAKAVKVVLERRGNINKGWSGAWKINQQARLEEPEEAYSILKSMLTDISIHPRPDDSEITPSFEGNQGIQGVTAGIAEMLMQSHSGEISLLPALPKAWQAGSIAGLRGKGGYTIDLSWKGHTIAEAKLTSKFTNLCKLRTKTPVKVMVDNKPLILTRAGDNVYTFNAIAGKTYYILPN